LEDPACLPAPHDRFDQLAAGTESFALAERQAVKGAGDKALAHVETGETPFGFVQEVLSQFVLSALAAIGIAIRDVFEKVREYRKQ
jgi:hypothetical protein